MRIGLFTDTYPPYINGVSTSVAMLKSALEKKGHQVFVLTSNNNSLKYKYEDGGTVIRVPAIPIGLYDYRLSGIYPVMAINKIRKWKLDVIHSHTEFGVGTFARIIAKQLDIPLVHTYHTMYEDYMHYITKGYFRNASNKLAEYITKFYCDKTISELIVPTKKTYDLFKGKYKVDRNIHIVPTGIDIERFYTENQNMDKVTKIKKEFGFAKDDFVILYVGRLAIEKNVEFLLDAQRSLIKKNKKYKLLIVGSGPDTDKYKKYITRHKLEKNIILAGSVPWENIPTYYHICSAFATASKSETQGLTVVEALAASKPVLCIDDPSFLNTIIDDLNGYVFKNKKEYLKSVIRLSEDTVIYNRISNQSRVSAEVHSSKYFAEKILDVYKVAINKNGKKSFWNRLFKGD